MDPGNKDENPRHLLEKLQHPEVENINDSSPTSNQDDEQPSKSTQEDIPWDLLAENKVLNDSAALEQTTANHFTQARIKTNTICVEEETKHDFPSQFPTYKKLPGTKDLGREFEQAMCGYYALKLAIRDDVKNFEMTTNNIADGKFDDIGIKITFTSGRARRFLFQLKHKESKKLNLSDLKSESKTNDFGVKKYIKSISEMDVKEEIVCILSTNSAMKINDNVQLSDEVSVERCNHLEFEDFLVNTEERHENAIFEIKSESLHQKFYLFTSQMNVKKTEDKTKALLNGLLQCEIHDAFSNYVKNWWSGKFILTKHDVIAKISELALSPYLKNVSAKICNDKTESFKPAIMNFPLTIVEELGEDVVENIWKSEESWAGDEFRKIHKNDSEINQDFSKAKTKFGLEEHQKNIVLWYLEKMPLIIEVNRSNKEKIKCVMKFLAKGIGNKKIVLSGQISKDDFESYDTLSSLSDVIEKCKDERYFSNIMQGFRVSLQGRGYITLENLISIDADVSKLIGVRELLTMSQKEYLLIGDQKDELLDFHIPRTISPTFVKTEDIFNSYQSLQDTLLVVNCEESFLDKVNGDVNTMELSQYMNEARSEKPAKFILLSTTSKCTNLQFETICKVSKKSNVYLFQHCEDEYCILMLTKGRKFKLETTFTKKTVKESKIFEYYNNPLQVFCAAPGMGKSTLMRVLYNSCPYDCLAVYVNLISYNSLLKEKPDFETILAAFLQIDATENDLFLELKQYFWKKRKLYMFLDGLDEIKSEYVELVLNFVKNLSGHIWISSRENLRERIRQTLNVVPIDINKLDKEEQNRYVNKKLKQSYVDEEIRKITMAVFDSTDLINNQNLLGVPLQLHIITEMFLNDRQVYEDLDKHNVFVLTKMYLTFFEGKIRYAYRKLVGENQEQQLGYMNNVLQAYEVLALKACLDEEYCQKLLQSKSNKLSLHSDETDFKKFLDELKTEGDKYGIIKRIDRNDQAIFTHQTYAEYFACVWLKKNFNEECRRFLQDKIFTSCENLRLMFDVMLAEDNFLHLAIIYENLEVVERHINNIDGDEFDKVINATDKGGRTLIHLAFSYSQKHPPLLTSKDDYLRKRELYARETPTYVKIIDRFLQEVKVLEKKDKLFDYDCVTYALQSGCLYPIEKILEKKLLTFDKLREATRKYDIMALLCCSAQFGYPNLLRELIQEYRLLVEEKKKLKVRKWLREPIEENQLLLELAVIGLDGDVCTPPRRGNVEVMEILQTNGIRFNYNEEHILEQACRGKCVDTLEILLSHNLKYSDEYPILHFLVEHCPERYCDEIVEAVLKFNIDVNARDHWEYTALHYAAVGADLIIVAALFLHPMLAVDAQDRDGATALHLACKEGRVEVVEMLLTNGADPNVTDTNENNALHYAARSLTTNQDVIKLLIDEPWSTTVRNQHGQTPLHLACERYIKGNVKILLEKGANVGDEDWNGNNALHYASMQVKSNQDVIKLLIDEDMMSLNAQNHDGQTPLHVACERGDSRNVEMLLQQLANWHLLDNEKNSALHYASMSSDPNTIKLLIDKEIGVNKENEQGQTPLHLACKKGRFRNAEMLLERGSTTYRVDKKGNDALHYAAMSQCNESIIGLLISKGLDVNARNKEGSAPIDLAYRAGHSENADWLLKNGAKQ